MEGRNAMKNDAQIRNSTTLTTNTSEDTLVKTENNDGSNTELSVERRILPLESSIQDHEAGSGVCNICFSTNITPENPIISCTGCGISLHETCYGTIEDPLTFRCEICRSNKNPDDIGCLLCPFKGGVFRRVKELPTQYCHATCATWIPEAFFDGNEISIVGIPESRIKLVCSICKEKGGCIQCTGVRCVTAFHVLCALRMDWKYVLTCINQAAVLQCFCTAHIDLASSGYMLLKDSQHPLTPVPKDVLSPMKKRRLMKLKSPMKFHHAHHIDIDPISQHRQGKEEWLRKLSCLTNYISGKKNGTDSQQQRSVQPNSTIVTTEKTQSSILGYVKKVSDTSLFMEEASRKRSMETKTVTNKEVKKSVPKYSLKRKIGCPSCQVRVRVTFYENHLDHSPQCKDNIPLGFLDKIKNYIAKAKHEWNGGTKSKGKKKKELRLPPSRTRRLPKESINDVENSSEDQTLLFYEYNAKSKGAPLETVDFWKTVNVAFFPKKIAPGKRTTNIVYRSCGVRFSEIPESDTMDKKETIMKAEMTDLRSDEKSIGFHGTKERDTVVTVDLPSAWIPLPIERDTEEVIVSAEQTFRAKLYVPTVIEKDPSNVLEPSSRPCVSVLFCKENSGSFLCNYASDNVMNDAETFLLTPERRLADIYLHGRSKPSINLANCIEWHDQQTPNLSLPVKNNDMLDEITFSMQALVSELRFFQQDNRSTLIPLVKQAQDLKQKLEDLNQENSVLVEYYLQVTRWKHICQCLIRGTSSSLSSPNPDDHESKDAPDNEEGTNPDECCCICFDAHSDELNPIIFCDECDIAVHKHCYGVDKIPNEEFYCDKCQLVRSKSVSESEVFCQLCPHNEGSLKRTITGEWVHVFCALWSPTAWVDDLYRFQRITLSAASLNQIKFPMFISQEIYNPSDKSDENIRKESVSVSLDKLKVHPPSMQCGELCSLCLILTGTTCQCSNSDCNESFHPMCAWLAGMYCRITSTKEFGQIYAGGGKGLMFEIFCPKHTEEMISANEQPSLLFRREKLRPQEHCYYESHTTTAQPGRPNILPHVINYNVGDRALPWVYRRRQLYSSVQLPKSIRKSVFDIYPRSICCVCFKGKKKRSRNDVGCDTEPQSVFLRCSKCNILVHPSCRSFGYNSDEDVIPNTSSYTTWLCQKCNMTPESKAKLVKHQQCEACGRSGGYLIPILNNERELPTSLLDNFIVMKDAWWIHLFCAIQTPWIRLHYNSAPQWTFAVMHNERKDSGRTCRFCAKHKGVVEKCYFKECNETFHPLCATLNGCYFDHGAPFESKLGEKTRIYRPGLYRFYCYAHTPKPSYYDIAEQNWVGPNVIHTLNEIRLSFETVRMMTELVFQREKRKKKHLIANHSTLFDYLLKSIARPEVSDVMKEEYAKLTGQQFQSDEDIPATEEPDSSNEPQSPNPPQKKSRKNSSKPTESTPKRLLPKRACTKDVASEVAEAKEPVKISIAAKALERVFTTVSYESADFELSSNSVSSNKRTKNLRERRRS